MHLIVVSSYFYKIFKISKNINVTVRNLPLLQSSVGDEHENQTKYINATGQFTNASYAVDGGQVYFTFYQELVYISMHSSCFWYGLRNS